MPLQPGDRFGRYELLALLGKGGMGDVFSARDTVLRRSVALKVLHPVVDEAGGGPDPKGASRILREARAAGALTHPNAIAIYDVGEEGGVPFLAMELVDGKTLRAFIRDESVTMERRIRWLADIARALGAAHKLGLVHRDIKPDNIMVREDGVVKVLDFGIARRVATSSSDPSMTTQRAGESSQSSGQGLVIGTPLYMAPEQMRAEAIDGRADQFSWGVVAYELLTGTLPWNRNVGELALIEQILKRDVVPLRLVVSEIPVAVDAAVRVALAKNARGRYESMQELADKLEPHAAPAGPPTGQVEGMPRPVRAQEQPTVRDAPPVPPTLPSAQPRASGAPASLSRARPWIAVAAVVLAVIVAAVVFALRWSATASPHP